jgi:CRISPR/Cas system-associated endonuclease Cas1
LTTPAIIYLLHNGIDCVLCDSYGKYYGRPVSTESKSGLLRQRQLEAVANQERKLAIAMEIVRGQVLNQRTLLMRYLRLPYRCHPAHYSEHCHNNILLPFKVRL